MPDDPAMSDLIGMPFGQARRAISRLLAASGCPSPEFDARLLVEEATGLSAEGVVAREHESMTSESAAVLSGLVARRLAGEPVSRIRGWREFYGRRFIVTPDVLDPRPETETLVDVVLETCDAAGGRHRDWRILDLGTGSGCLLATLLAELPQARGLGVDISLSALQVAQENAHALGVADRAIFRVGRGLDGIEGPFDVLISNPPYIPTNQIPELAIPVRDFDPHIALDGGADGLQVYRDIAASSLSVVPEGWIVLEVGAEQAPGVASILTNALGPRIKRLIQRKDLAGHSRCVAVQTQP